MATPDNAPAPRTRPMEESPALATLAAKLLCRTRAFVAMNEDDARDVVSCMRLATFPKGAAVFRQGDDSSSSYLLLLLEGEVTVDTTALGQPNAVAISVLGPGDIIGEMALFDGEPRSATCIAMSAVQAAGLSRKGLELLVEKHPQTAARLLVMLGQRLSERLRALSQQLQIMAQLGKP